MSAVGLSLAAVPIHSCLLETQPLFILLSLELDSPLLVSCESYVFIILDSIPV